MTRRTKDGKIISKTGPRHIYLRYDKIKNALREEPFEIPIDKLLEKMTMSIYYARPYESKEDPIYFGDYLVNYTNKQEQFSNGKKMKITFSDDVEEYEFVPC